MNAQPVPLDPKGQPQRLLPDAAHNLTVDEVGALWSFVHGDIMDGSTRDLLRASWGLCDRHSWGHAVVEIELWEAGAGARGGHQPFDVSILYADLLRAMSHSLSTGRSRSRNKALIAVGDCLVCKDLRGSTVPGLSVGYAGFQSEKLIKESAPMMFTQTWAEQSASIWQGRICPDCAEEANLARTNAARCRSHLIATGRVDAETFAEIVDKLRNIRFRISQLIDSMTQAGAPSTPEADASWIEALGWFHGWALPIALSAKRATI